MNYNILKNQSTSTVENILLNRGIKKSDIQHYLHTTDDDINNYVFFGFEDIVAGTDLVEDAVKNNKSMLVVVDADCDGYTSAALWMNYFYLAFEDYYSNIHYFIHSGKQHGLNDCIEEAKNYDVIILPDSSSNDYSYHKILKDLDKQILIMDHHEAERKSEYAIVINNQLSDYPNKDLSGVGVTWQFCRALDDKFCTSYTDRLLDLVALGNTADMMSLKSIETKHLIWKGFKRENIKNPFIYGMIDKNNFSLNKADYKSYNGLDVTPMGAAFFIAPFVNAMVRSGTQEEKEILFKSMLISEAFKEVPSTKRGHKIGDKERIVDQALRICTNVKNRQTKAQDNCVALLEKMIEEKNLLKDKVLLFLLEPGQIDKNVAGLAANKIMAKYQRPVCVLTKVIKDGEISYQGSARGYDAGGVNNFKDICTESNVIMYAEGHQSAFGLGIPFCYPGEEEVQGEKLYAFRDYTNEVLKDMSDEPIYTVDYEFNGKEDNEPATIIEIAEMNDFWGKDLDRPHVLVKFKMSDAKFTVMKSNTLKFTLPNNISIIKFSGTDEEIQELENNLDIEITAICKCNENEWGGSISAQLILEDYEIQKIPHRKLDASFF